MFLYKSSASCWRRRRERERNVLACVWIKRICRANFCLSSCPLISRLDERQAAAPSEVSLRTSGWSDGLGGSNWVRAAGFSLQQSHSLPGGRSHASMLFITPNKQQGRKTNQGGNRRTTAARGGLIISWYFFSLRLCVLCFEAGINRIEQNRITLMIPDWDLTWLFWLLILVLCLIWGCFFNFRSILFFTNDKKNQTNYPCIYNLSVELGFRSVPP